MRGIIYTSIMGDYDVLKEPSVITPKWDYVCFTNQDIKSDTWNIEMVEFNGLSDVKASKRIKILKRLYLRGYDYVIWCDASLRINCNLNDFIKKYYVAPLTVMAHPCRTCIYKEGEIIKREKIDDDVVIDNQILRYRDDGFPENYGLTANGIIITNGKIPEEYSDFFIDWWGEVSRGSKRDQMSFMYIMWKYRLEYHTIPYDVINNEFKFSKHNNGTSKKL